MTNWPEDYGFDDSFIIFDWDYMPADEEEDYLEDWEEAA